LEIEGIPITDEDGAIKMKPWTPADFFVDREWDMCLLDEAHRIKRKIQSGPLLLNDLKTEFVRI
jgi:hypothetical protein